MVMCVFGWVSMCNYIGLKNFMLIDGIFYPIGHTFLNDQTYETSEFIHNCSLQGQWL